MKLSSFSKSKIDHFEKSFGDAHLMFACEAAVPLIFSTELLYKMWLNFNTYSFNGRTEKIPHWAVSDLVLSGFCQPVGYELYKLDTEIRLYLLQQLTERLGAARQLEIAAFLQQFAEKYYAGSEKNIQEIHLLTAASILDPAAMEQQLSSQLAEKIQAGSKDIVNLLTLYFNLAGEASEDAATDNQVTLVEETDSTVPGYLNIKLPGFLQARVKERANTTGVDIPDKASDHPSYAQALAVVEECLRGRHPELRLDNCGLTDADFEEGTPLDKVIRQCTHLKSLVLSNGWYDLNRLSHRRVVRYSSNNGKKNLLNKIPSCVGQLVSLSTFICGGDAGSSWGIKDLAIMETLTSIRRLHMPCNNIGDITGIANRERLAELDLRNNQISDITVLQTLPGLQQLDLRNNQVASLRPLLEWFQKTNDIRLNLEADPHDYFNNSIYLSGNPLTDPPPYIIQRSTSDVIQYLTGNTTVKKVPVWVCQTWKENPDQFSTKHVFHESTEDYFCPEEPAYHGVLVEELIPEDEAAAIQNTAKTKQPNEEENSEPAFPDIKPEQPTNSRRLEKVYLLYDFDSDRDHPLLAKLKASLEELNAVVQTKTHGESLQVEGQAISDNDAVILFYGNADREWFLMRQSLLMDKGKDKRKTVFLAEPSVNAKRKRDIAQGIDILTERNMQSGIAALLKDDRFNFYNQLVGWNFKKDLFTLTLPPGLNRNSGQLKVIYDKLSNAYDDIQVQKMFITALSELIVLYNGLEEVVTETRSAIGSLAKKNRTEKILDALKATESSMDMVHDMQNKAGENSPDFLVVNEEILRIVNQELGRLVYQAATRATNEVISKRPKKGMVEFLTTVLTNEFGKSDKAVYDFIKRRIADLLIDRRIRATTDISNQENPDTSEIAINTIDQKPPSYDIFSVYISCTSRDAEFRKKVSQDLTTRFPLIVIFDTEMLAPGVDWIKAAADWIEKADYFIFVLTDSYASSAVCWDEFQVAKLYENDNKKEKIICTKYDLTGAEIPPIMNIYSPLDFRNNYRGAFEQLARHFTNHKKNEVAAELKKIYFLSEKTDDRFCTTLKREFAESGFDVNGNSNIFSIQQTDYSRNEQLQNLRESKFVLIVLGNDTTFSKESWDELRHAQQEGKTIELITSGTAIIPEELHGYHIWNTSIGYEQMLNDFNKKHFNMSSSLAPSEKENKPAFFTKKELSDMISSSEKMDKNEIISEFLLIFSTSEQQTWLIFSNKNIYCLLDDVEKRNTGKLIQWVEPLNTKRNVSVKLYTAKTGRVTVGTRQDWLYSYSLFDKPDSIIDEIKRCTERALKGGLA